MKNKIIKFTAMIAISLLLAYSIYASYLFYLANCQQVRESSVPMTAPSRCLVGCDYAY